MSSYIKIIYDKLDFIEFKQNILLLKQPQHKASIFCDLTLEDFLKIRDLEIKIIQLIKENKKYTINDFEKDLFRIWPSVRSYPSSATLVAKALLESEEFNFLFKYLN